MANPQSPPSPILADQQRKLTSLEGAYLRAKEYVKSEQYEADMSKLMSRLAKAIPRDKQWTGESALVAVGAARQAIDMFLEPTEVISQYESLKESVRKYTEGK